MSEPGPHDCGPDCHPLRASDGVSPACSDDCQKPLGHPGWCDDPMLAERRRDAAWARRLADVYGPGHTLIRDDREQRARALDADIGRMLADSFTPPPVLRTDPAEEYPT